MVKKLYRTEGNDAKIAGVCGGLAEYFDLDPTIVRLIAVALVLAPCCGVLLYIIGALVIPKKSKLGL